MNEMELWDPGKGKVITYFVKTTIPIAFIFTRYCLISMFYLFYANDRKYVAENLHRGRTYE